MKFDIPHYRQEKSLSCGLAVLRMVLGYYDDNATEKELSKGLKMHSFGSFTTDIASIAQQRRYKTSVYSFHLPLLSPLKLPFGCEIKLEHLKKMKVDPKSKMTFDSWKKYLEVGGKIIWDYPKISQINDLIHKKIPCVININTAALNRYWKNWDNGHFVVVNGVENNKVSVLDPDLPIEKAEYEIDTELLLPSWSINSRVSSGYIMIIEKK